MFQNGRMVVAAIEYGGSEALAPERFRTFGPCEVA